MSTDSDESTLNETRLTVPEDLSALVAAMSVLGTGPPALPVGADGSSALARTGGVPGQWMNASGRPAADAGVTLFLHGGGFEQRNPAFERVMAYRFSKATNRPVFGVDYRLAPSHPFPAAHDDVLSAYRGLLEQDVPADGIILLGESAGATLALSALHTIRAEKLPFPSGVAAVSPITDLTLSSPSIDSPGVPDMLNRAVLERIVGQYLAGAARDQAPQSPLHGDLSGFPPLLIATGEGEALLDDARRFATEAAKHTTVTLDIYKGMPHGFHASVLLDSPPEVATTFLRCLKTWADALT